LEIRLELRGDARRLTAVAHGPRSAALLAGLGAPEADPQSHEAHKEDQR